MKYGTEPSGYLRRLRPRSGPGPWHHLPARTDGYGFPLPPVALCGVVPSQARYPGSETVEDGPDVTGLRCRKCERLAEGKS